MEPFTIANYVLLGELTRGGMATIWIGHAIGETRPLAIKILNAQATGSEMMMMFLDELAVAKRLRHLNIVQTFDVISTDEELGLVMEYVEGETLSRLVRSAREQGTQVPIAIAARIVCGALAGLHAAHEATDENGEPLGLVHRDVSPQNVVVGVDGIPRLLDFGVVKAANRLQQTRSGQLKGKVAYMAPEHLEKAEVSRSSDVYAMGVVLWEALAGRRLFEADTEGQLVHCVLRGVSEPPSVHRPEIPAALDAAIMRALATNPADRFPSARHFAGAIELAADPAATSEVAPWLREIAKKALDTRARRIAKMFGVPTADSSSELPSSPSLPAESSSSVGSGSPSGPLIPATSSQRTSPLVARDRSRSGDVAPPREAAARRSSLRSEEILTSPNTRIQARHILVVDDSTVILDNARRVLEADGFRVTTTTQTVGAARYLVDCDLALIDYHMPGLNGASVIESFRNATRASGRTCLFYLYTSDPDVAKHYATEGFDGVLTGKGDDAALLRGVRAAFRVLGLRAMKR